MKLEKKHAQQILNFFTKNSMIKDIIPTPTSQPNKQPADGEKKTESPPLPPDNNGAPITTKDKKIATVEIAFLKPSIAPANITPRVCAVIGTPGKKGKSIFGIKPKTLITAT